MKLNLSLSGGFKTVLAALILCAAVFPARLTAFPAPQWLQGGHSARITGLARSPDGTMLVSASEDGTVKLWSTNGALVRTLASQSIPFTAIAWSPDGSRIAAGSYNGGYLASKAGLGLTYLWQASGGWSNNVSLVRITTNLYGTVTALAFTTDSARLASGSAAGTNSVTTVASGSLVAAFAAYDTNVRPSAVSGIAFAANGLMASGSDDGTIRVYTNASSSWSQSWSSTTAHGTNVTAVGLSPNGALLATAGLDKTLRVWSTTSASLQQTLVHPDNVTSAAFSPDGTRLVSGCADGMVRIWNPATGASLLTIAAHAMPVTTAIFSADGSVVISASDDGTIRLWSAMDGSAICVLGAQSYFISAAAVSADGLLCASAGGDATIQIRRTSDGSLVRTLVANSNFVTSLAFSPDHERLASGGGPLDPTIKIWQLSDGALLNTIPATTNGVTTLTWSPDGLTLACGGDSVEQSVYFYSTNGILQGLLAGTVTGHTNGVTALVFSPQGNLLASGGRRPGNMVRIWTNNTPGIWTTASLVRTYTSPSTNNNVESIAFSPDGSLVAFGRTAVDVLKVGGVFSGANWTLGSGTNPVYSVAFSPDGKSLAATDQNSVQLWTTDGSSWTQPLVITQEIVRASSLAFSPNQPSGYQLLCGREDGTLTMTSYTATDLLPSVGQASNPSPADGSSGIAVRATLGWTSGNNALTHALYVGFSSNAVAQATPASPVFQGVLANPTFSPTLISDATIYWRVDELSGPATNTGAVWTFTTVPAIGHRYTFSENGGTAIADSISGAPWTGTVFNSGTLSGGQLTLASNLQQYATLPTGIVSGLNDFTIELWAKLNSSANSMRFFDFGSGTGNYMFLTPQSGSTGRLRFGLLTTGNTEQDINGPNALTIGVWNHLAVTLKGDTGILYLNGVAVGTNSAMTLKPAGLGSTPNNYLGRSQFAANPYLNGALDEFRIYNTALSPAEIAATYALGSAQTLSPTSPRLSQTVGPANLTFTWPLTAGSYQLESCDDLTTGIWVNVTTPAPQILGGNLQVTVTPTNGARYFRLSR